MAPKRNWREMHRPHPKPKYKGRKKARVALLKKQQKRDDMERVRAIAEAKHEDNRLARYLERKRFYGLLRNKYPPQSGLSPGEIKQLRHDLATPRKRPKGRKAREADIKRRVEAMKLIQATEEWCRDIVKDGPLPMEIEDGEGSNDDQYEEEEEELDEDDWGYEEEPEDEYEEDNEADDGSGWLNPGHTITDNRHDYSDLEDSAEDSNNDDGEEEDLEAQEELRSSRVDDQGDVHMLNEAGGQTLAIRPARKKQRVSWADEDQSEMDTLNFGG